MSCFLDTSALAKLYHQESGSTFLEQLLPRHDRSAFVSRLGVLEMHSVLAGKVRTGEIDPAAMELTRQRFRGELRRRRFRVIALRARHYQQAETLLYAHGPSGLRTLDALQLAVALDLHRNQLIDSFVAADRILCRVAQLEGLQAINPEIGAE